jgi:pimeloyl-ACP methyl ester carboxylesterase
MTSSLHVVRVGRGPTLVLVHGSAADHTAWSIQLASPLREQFTLVAYDRRGGDASVEAHAADAVAVADAEPGPVVLVGSSFGAVIALEAIRSHPAPFAGAVLIEPPMAASDDTLAAPAYFLAEYDRRIAEQGGPDAAEFFLRTVLGDELVERMPRLFLDRAIAKWKEIRDDSASLIAYRPRYAELANVRMPVLLVGGERSPFYFGATLAALCAAIPGARRETIANAGHMLHAEAHRSFADVVTAFATEVLAGGGDAGRP